MTPSPELRALLEQFYTPAEIEAWLDAPQPLWDGVKPRDMIADGREAELIAGLQRMDAGVYL